MDWALAATMASPSPAPLAGKQTLITVPVAFQMPGLTQDFLQQVLYGQECEPVSASPCHAMSFQGSSEDVHEKVYQLDLEWIQDAP